MKLTHLSSVQLQFMQTQREVFICKMYGIKAKLIKRVQSKYQENCNVFTGINQANLISGERGN